MMEILVATGGETSFAYEIPSVKVPTPGLQYWDGTGYLP
jgi:hypothetical protein